MTTGGNTMIEPQIQIPGLGAATGKLPGYQVIQHKVDTILFLSTMAVNF